jgi:putative FmdB family regulatory protein
MPIYEYQCSKCETVYERFMKVGEPHNDLECPSCGAKNPNKLATAFRTNAWSSFLDDMDKKVSPEKFK